MVVVAVLRLANALRGHSDSRLAGVREGVAAVGRKQLYRWVMLMLLASRDSVAGSLEPQMLMALHRARLMQEVCASAGPPLAELADEAFLVGTISLMQGVLKKSPAELVERVLAGDATRECMLASSGPLARPLALVKALEEERFEAAGEIASGLGVAPGLLLNCQQATMHWLSEVKEQCYQ
jgi:EAL and modified HD-GYP domain-containing signal transduction protein